MVTLTCPVSVSDEGTCMTLVVGAKSAGHEAIAGRSAFTVTMS
jgi:hypothetical protein